MSSETRHAGRATGADVLAPAAGPDVPATAAGTDVLAPAAGADVLAPDVVAALVLTVPGVAALHGGPFGEVATYLPGRTVRGVRLRPDGTHVHVVLRAGANVRDTADAVRRAVSRVADRPVHITVEDVEP